MTTLTNRSARVRLRTLALISCALVGISDLLTASVVVPISLPALIRRADVIALATVTSVPSFEVTPGNGLKIRHVQLALEDGKPLKGSWSDQPWWDAYADTAVPVQQGQRLLLFLHQKDADGLIDTLGPTAQFLVTSSECHHVRCDVAVNSVNNEGLWDRSLFHSLLGKEEPEPHALKAHESAFEHYIDTRYSDSDTDLRYAIKSHLFASSAGPVPLELIRATIAYIQQHP